MEDKKVVIFELDSENFAVDIMQVERIIEYEEPTKIPDSLPYIKGVIRYQENILPIIDIKKIFKLNASVNKQSSKIIVIKNNENVIGLIVDSVKEVTNVKGKQIETPSDIIKGISNNYLNGMIKLDKKIIILIDSNKILSKEEINDINNIVK